MLIITVILISTSPTMLAADLGNTTEVPSDSSIKPWWEWNYASGDWGGARPWLLNHGINLQFIYTFETFSNVRGGASTEDATKPYGNFDMLLTLDSEKLGLWKGGTLFLQGENLAGDSTGIEAAVGFPFNPVSNMNAPSFTTLIGYYYAQVLGEGLVTLKAGKLYASADFISSNITGQFINNGLNPPPNIPMSNFPNSVLGFVGNLSPASWFSLAGGVYGGTPNGLSFGDGGLFQGNIFSIIQPAFKHSFGNYAGNYRFGGWLLTQDTPAISSTLNPRVFPDNYGAYFLFDQQIYKEHPDQDQGPGLTAFIQLSWAPADRNQVNLSVAGGLMYTGLIPGRTNDNLGFSINNAHATPQGLTHETVLEGFYQVILTPWLTIQPDIQYFINPRGNGRDALAIGIRNTVAF
jgi:porin